MSRGGAGDVTGFFFVVKLIPFCCGVVLQGSKAYVLLWHFGNDASRRRVPVAISNDVQVVRRHTNHGFFGFWPYGIDLDVNQPRVVSSQPDQ